MVQADFLILFAGYTFCRVIPQSSKDARLILLTILGMGSLANIFGVEYFGTTEFWLAMGKIILFLGLTFYTIVTMSGGNPARHAYGFEYEPRP